jgi:hypothetical protein
VCVCEGLGVSSMLRLIRHGVGRYPEVNYYDNREIES